MNPGTGLLPGKADHRLQNCLFYSVNKRMAMDGVVVVVVHLVVCFTGAWSGILGDDHKGIQNGLDVRNVTFREGILHKIQENIWSRLSRFQGHS